MTSSDESPRGVPDWFVTFADMMALLLTFFLMLLSCSEIKSEEKYQALMDSFQQQFGQADNRPRVAPGELRPRSTLLAQLSKQKQVGRGDVFGSLVENRESAVESVAAVVELRGDQREFDATQLAELQELAMTARQQGGKIVIRVATKPETMRK